MHTNHVLNLEILKTLMKGLSWGLKASNVEFEWFNTDHISTFKSKISMYDQVVFYDNEESINFPIVATGSTIQNRKSFNINHLNWIILDGIKYDIKNIASTTVFHINSNVNEAKETKALKVAA